MEPVGTTWESTEPALPAEGPWALYDRMIAGVPEGITVKDVCINIHWCYVEAECGMGVGFTVKGGAKTRAADEIDPNRMELHELAALVKSWNFIEASLGIAALNAWYAQPDRLSILGASIDSGSSRGNDPFHDLMECYTGKNVCVVGHFPRVAALTGKCNLTVLERECNSHLDMPDSACEFVMPQQDLALITGTTLTNKTAVRLLQLCANVDTVMVGPSAVPAPALMRAGANLIAGSTVTNAENAKKAVKGGTKELWRAGISRFMLRD